MSVVRRIAKNTSALFIAQIVFSVVSLIFGIVIARELGDNIFGKFAFALAFTEIFSIFISLGYNTLIVREVSRDKTQVNKYINNIFSFRIVFSLVLFVLIVIAINLLQYPDDTKLAVYLLGIFQILEALARFQGHIPGVRTHGMGGSDNHHCSLVKSPLTHDGPLSWIWIDSDLFGVCCNWSYGFAVQCRVMRKKDSTSQKRF